MTYMLVRNRVEDFDTWKKVFDADTERGKEAGLTLERMWRETDDPDNVFFVLKVADLDRAKAFLSSPESGESGETSGVIDGEFYFVDSVPL